MSRHLRPSVQMHEGAKLVLMPISDPAVCDLLDHLAGELAKEYVRLMQGAVPSDSCANVKPEEKTS